YLITSASICSSPPTDLYLHSFPTRRSFRSIPANWLRTLFSILLIKIDTLLKRFFRPIFRMGPPPAMRPGCWPVPATCGAVPPGRSEEHTSELQSRFDLVCRHLLEKKKLTES